MSASPSWVAALDASEEPSLAVLRLVPGLLIALLPPTLWLRGSDWNADLAMAFRKIPGLRRFTLLDGRRLIAEGARVPSGNLPELRWEPLRERFPVSLPPAVPVVEDLCHAPLTLVRSSIEQPANALLTDRLAWRDFATTTAQVRLRALRFAAALDGRVWIEGQPVPALPGRRFWQQDGIAVPCGWTWAPAVEAGVLRRWLGMVEGDTAVALPDGDWEIIKGEQFVPATRQAARLTAEFLCHE